MKILVTRHGQTDWNLDKKVQGKADIELNEKGRQQAEETKKLLDYKDIDLIICSPLIRARQTAEIINKERNIPIIFEDGISERNFGEFEGHSTSEFDFEAFWSYQKNLKYETAENIRDFFERVYSCIKKIQLEHKSKKILIVSHGGVSIPIQCYFDGIPNQETLLPLAIGNCQVIEYDTEKVKDNDYER